MYMAGRGMNGIMQNKLHERPSIFDFEMIIGACIVGYTH